MLELSHLARPASRHQPINLFFALMPDSAAAAQANRIAKHHHADRRMSGKLLAPHRLHVTLSSVGGFFGEVPDPVMRMARSAGDAVRAAPFEVSLDHATSFPRRTGQRPYVLLGGDGVIDVMPLYRQLGGAMLAAGLEVAIGHVFNPHMTLAYTGGHHVSLPTKPVSWIAREFVLIESWVGLTQHHVRGRWTLRE